MFDWYPWLPDAMQGLAVLATLAVAYFFGWLIWRGFKAVTAEQREKEAARARWQANARPPGRSGRAL